MPGVEYDAPGDLAGYGPITISQAVTIEGQGWSYMAPAANSPAITINAVSGNVYIHGVSLNGVGITGTTTGILFNSGGGLYVRDSVIRNFGGDGIGFVPNSSTKSQLFVSNTVVSDNFGQGIDIRPTGSGTTTGVLDRVDMENNTNDGLLVSSGTGIINVTVSDSVSANNAAMGILSSSGGDTPLVSVMVRNSTIANNGTNGLAASCGTGTNAATLRFTRSTITGNTTAGWASIGAGIILSYGDNNIDGNTNGNTEPPGPLTYK